jgi:hypothetical protein
MKRKVIPLNLTCTHHPVTGKRPTPDHARQPICCTQFRHDVGTTHDNAKNGPSDLLVLLQQFDNHCSKLLTVHCFNCFHLFHLQASLAPVAVSLAFFRGRETVALLRADAPRRDTTPAETTDPSAFPSPDQRPARSRGDRLSEAMAHPLHATLSIESSKCHGNHRGSEK